MKLILTKKREINIVEDALLHFISAATYQEMKEWLGWSKADIMAAESIVGQINIERSNSIKGNL